MKCLKRETKTHSQYSESCVCFESCQITHIIIYNKKKIACFCLMLPLLPYWKLLFFRIKFFLINRLCAMLPPEPLNVYFGCVCMCGSSFFIHFIAWIFTQGICVTHQRKCVLFFLFFFPSHSLILMRFSVFAIQNLFYYRNKWTTIWSNVHHK